MQNFIENKNMTERQKHTNVSVTPYIVLNVDNSLQKLIESFSCS